MYERDIQEGVGYVATFMSGIIPFIVVFSEVDCNGFAATITNRLHKIIFPIVCNVLLS
jgi:hypothetical protein